MTDPRRRVLCVAYFFPPLGGVSVARMVSFVRNLPAAGWDPVVIAPRGSAYPLRDPSGLTRVPDSVAVRRALSPEPQSARQGVGPALAGVKRFGAAFRRRVGAPSAGPSVRNGGSGDTPNVAPSRSPVSLAAVRRWLFFPDDQMLWLPFAVRAGRRIAREGGLDAIYSTSSPISGHLVAGVLHRLTGVPWVAEFRDPWIGNVLAEPLPPIHQRLQRRLERWIVGTAARVVFLSAATEADYVRRYPSLAGRSVVVPNGYDADDLGPPPARPPVTTPIRLVYTGTLDRPIEAAAFLSGLAELVRRRPEVTGSLTIDVVGHTSAEVARLAAPYLESAELRSILRFVPYAPRAEALRYVREADACLVLLGEEPGMSQFIPGKLFDYIGLDAPILAVVPQGEVSSLLEQLEWGVVVDPTTEGVVDGLERLLAGRYRTGRADREGVYERRKLAIKLASVLDEVAAHAPS
jgi:glycosyltransferase involved in cell wall biosynthesis